MTDFCSYLDVLILACPPMNHVQTFAKCSCLSTGHRVGAGKDLESDFPHMGADVSGRAVEESIKSDLVESNFHYGICIVKLSTVV